MKLNEISSPGEKRKQQLDIQTFRKGLKDLNKFINNLRSLQSDIKKSGKAVEPSLPGPLKKQTAKGYNIAIDSIEDAIDGLKRASRNF